MTDKKDEALKLALQALEYISSHYMSLPKIGCMALAVVEEALAEPAQQEEPVAWMFQHEETGRTMCVDAQQLEWGFEKGNPRLKKIAPLYTSSQPSKPWVGLTRDERMDIINRFAGQDWVYAVEAIEAKLREKNGGGV